MIYRRMSAFDASTVVRTPAPIYYIHPTFKTTTMTALTVVFVFGLYLMAIGWVVNRDLDYTPNTMWIGHMLFNTGNTTFENYVKRIVAINQKDTFVPSRRHQEDGPSANDATGTTSWWQSNMSEMKDTIVRYYHQWLFMLHTKNNTMKSFRGNET
jgi:hypothetical protein